ncbi:MAG: A/G-specific adenine glycosylase [Anaerolineae bacterium]|nr:A/G-specific adenine glycosylase [Anaerolineae bacterium]
MSRSADLLAWFAHNARDLPWRHNRTPYRVWVAEVMLQQTRVETVIHYYERFTSRFPTLPSLADASLEEVLQLWEGLGYYARARNLHAAARLVAAEQGGQLPTTCEELRALPGFGPYIAAAVASIAFGQPAVAIDGNARRVASRVWAIEGDPRCPPARQKVAQLLRSLLPADRPGVFNEAVMELGATVCLPRRPRCQRCPWAAGCQAHQAGREDEFPHRSPRRTVPHHDVAAAVLQQDSGQVLVTRRALDDFLGGLWSFPCGKQEGGESLEDCLARTLAASLGIEVDVQEQLLTLKHAYTHFRITLHAFRCRLRAGSPRCHECVDVRWVAPPGLDELAMSAVDRRIAQFVQHKGPQGK